jgi:aryl-alcohol dehydrogenase-like predicted oxidoreductase
MEKRKLGKNGPNLSVLGLGTWVMGGPWRYGWGPQDDKESIATIHKAIDNGINWIDTAAVYGLGHAERVVARALAKKRDKVFIATKCGLVWQKEIKKRPHNLTRTSIRREIEDSLQRLKTDYIDLYQLHSPDPETPVEESWSEMLALQKEGKVRWIGVSNFNMQLMKRCLKLGHVDSLQPVYNLLNRDIENEIVPFCHQNGIGIISYSPLASGLLSGKFDREKLAINDWRSKDTDFKGEALKKKLGYVEKLNSIAKEQNTTVGNLAIAWVLQHPEISSTILGVRNRQQLNKNIKATLLKLETDVEKRIADF